MSYCAPYRWIALLGLAMVIAPACGCERVRTRKAIERYSLAIADVNTHADALNLAQSKFKTHARGDLMTLKAFVDRQLLPRWHAYLTALEKVPCDTDTLRNLHQLVLDAQRKRLAALRAFRANLTAANRASQLSRYMAATARSQHQAREYRTKMTAYFRRFGVKLANNRDKR